MKKQQRNIIKKASFKVYGFLAFAIIFIYIIISLLVIQDRSNEGLEAHKGIGVKSQTVYWISVSD